MDYGMLQVGIINVPIYPTISEREYEHIFNEAEIKWPLWPIKDCATRF